MALKCRQSRFLTLSTLIFEDINHK